jgi:hypothetical protein
MPGGGAAACPCGRRGGVPVPGGGAACPCRAAGRCARAGRRRKLDMAVRPVQGGPSPTILPPAAHSSTSSLPASSAHFTAPRARPRPASRENRPARARTAPSAKPSSHHPSSAQSSRSSAPRRPAPAHPAIRNASPGGHRSAARLLTDGARPRVSLRAGASGGGQDGAASGASVSSSRDELCSGARAGATRGGPSGPAPARATANAASLPSTGDQHHIANSFPASLPASLPSSLPSTGARLSVPFAPIPAQHPAAATGYSQQELPHDLHLPTAAQPGAARWVACDGLRPWLPPGLA